MPDIKSLNISNNNKITELEGKSITIEKPLPTLIEDSLITLLDAKFFAADYSTGVKHKWESVIDNSGYAGWVFKL